MNIRIFIILCLCLILTPAFSQAQAVDEEEYVFIGGIDQWVTIRGSDVTKPMILFLHGGPGSVMSPYEGAVYGDWEKDFVLVNWDQRGAGRTFGRNAPADVDEDYWIKNPLTVEQMTADGIALAEYLVEKYEQDKVILIGTSWGSVLGIRMALKRPDLFHAYIGHAQIVNPSEGLRLAYHRVSAMAERAGDKTSQDKLNAIGSPPFDDARKAGQLFRIIKKYEAGKVTPAPEAWFKLSPDYDNETDSMHRYNGDDYSFIHFVGHKALDIKAMERQAEKVASVIHANDELFNKGNLDYADQLFAADYAGGGPGIVKNFISARRSAFPDLKVKIDPVISDGDMVAWLRTSTGTQRGDYAGRRPTNKKITWKEMVFTKYNEEGKIAEEWAVSEMGEMLIAARDIDGLYEYLPPAKGQGVNQNGRFLYLSGPADGKEPMAGSGGAQTVSGDTITNYVEFSTNPKLVGTMYMWRVTSWSGDTIFYNVMDTNGNVTGDGRAVRTNR